MTDRRPPFKYSALARVWFSDTDAQGIVYYGRYLPYFDHARTEYHRHLANAPFSQAGGDLVMRALQVEYHAPARFDDLIEAFVRVSRIGTTSMTYQCAAYRLPEDELMVTAELTVVLVDLAERKPVADSRGDPRRRRDVRGRRPRGVTPVAGQGEECRAPTPEASARSPSLSPLLSLVTRSGDAIPRTRYPTRTGVRPRSGGVHRQERGRRTA